MEQDQEFLEAVVKALVDNPDDVKIDRTVDEMGVLLTLDVNSEDMGKVIGRSGATAKAIRTLLRVVGLRHNARINLKINEPEGGRRAPETAAEAPTVTAADDVDEVMADLKADEEPKV
jgi:predicted RNA-binding protein YlqC (UPF0109 family)